MCPCACLPCPLGLPYIAIHVFEATKAMCFVVLLRWDSLRRHQFHRLNPRLTAPSFLRENTRSHEHVWRKTIDPNSWMTGRPKISKDHKPSSYTSSFISLTKKKHIPQAASSCLGRIQRPTHQKNQLGHPHPLTFVPSTIWPHLRG